MKKNNFWIYIIIFIILLIVVAYFSIWFLVSIDPITQGNKEKFISYIWGFSIGVTSCVMILFLIKALKE